MFTIRYDIAVSERSDWDSNPDTKSLWLLTVFKTVALPIRLITPFIKAERLRLELRRRKTDYWKFSKLLPYQIRLIAPKTPYTGFEPASLLQPTVFETAPSPPGHTAYYIKKYVAFNSPSRVWTYDTLVNSQPLCLLSYRRLKTYSCHLDIRQCLPNFAMSVLSHFAKVRYC